ncbi:unnamed protein product [Orchesella dallaii]|uniref:Uncharacterized protein n=1 Tax=Orchesella dallaii TaxID=48710 RepID=A0ABP1R0Q9_9HEXA
MLRYKFEIFILLSSYTITSYGQLHLLKYINAGTNPPQSSPAQFNSSLSENDLSNTRNKFARADRICVSGMWALYNTTDYGEGAEDSTTVISVRGTDINTCTQAGQIPVLRNVQSVHYLGSTNYGEDGVVIYALPYLLGGMWSAVLNGVVTPLPTGIRGFSLGSIAMTGNNSWIICGDTDTPCTNGVCINMRNFGSLFLQRNAARDTSLPNGWPRTVRQVNMVSSNECSNYPSPPPLLNNRRIIRSATQDVDISIFTSP